MEQESTDLKGLSSSQYLAVRELSLKSVLSMSFKLFITRSLRMQFQLVMGSISIRILRPSTKKVSTPSNLGGALSSKDQSSSWPI
jgi:hypothetical protein